ncbi:MAG: GTP-binding protein [Wenzhouxiangellaceae bacterium]
MLLKVLFAGPVSAGKTSAIASVSDSPVRTTEARASNDTARLKPLTTIAMDYGTLAVDDEITIQLVGTPGQYRFKFMWEILSRGAVGVVILVDLSSPDPLDDLDRYLDAFPSLIDQPGCACVIGATHGDQATPRSMQPLHDHLQKRALRLPLMEVDARERVQVRTLLLTMAAMLNLRTHRTSAT